MTKVDDFIASKLKTAKLCATEDQVRQIKSSMKAANIWDVIDTRDFHLANRIFDKNVETLKIVSTSACPRCHAPMVGTKLATRRLANYCMTCRVVTPQS